MKQVRIGFIGCGEIAEMHREALARIPEAALCAVHDRDMGAAEAFAVRAGAQAVGDVAALLADVSLDAVYILTRHDSHPELTIRAVVAGKAVFCEKPLALTVAEADAVVSQVESAGATVMVGFSHRWDPVVRRAKAWADRQATPPMTLHVSFVTSPFLESWAGLPDEGGGVFHCLGSHAVDLAQYLMGRAFTRVEATQARLRLPEPYLPDTAALLLQADDGALASALLHDHAPVSYIQYVTGEDSHLLRAELFGDGWAVVIDSLSRLRCYDAQGCHEVAVRCDSRIERFGILAENQHFVQCVLQGAPPSPGVRDGASVVSLIETAAKTAQSRWGHIPQHEAVAAVRNSS
ncbi:MAG: inositol 2-dehydrogenase [Anaerolineae bacterium]